MPKFVVSNPVNPVHPVGSSGLRFRGVGRILSPANFGRNAVFRHIAGRGGAREAPVCNRGAVELSVQRADPGEGWG